jgi:hypothetical protein
VALVQVHDVRTDGVHEILKKIKKPFKNRA